MLKKIGLATAVSVLMFLTSPNIISAYSLTITVATDKEVCTRGELVSISGNISYDGLPLNNKLVSIEVKDPLNATILMQTRQSDSEGRFNTSFRLSTMAEFGTYTVYVASEHNSEVATDQAQFGVTSFGTIYIRSDGSIDPPNAPVSTEDNITYTLTDNVCEPIVIERSYIAFDAPITLCRARVQRWESTSMDMASL
ncbi:MAG: hypothetical protein QHH24_02810 [Candidatus Bathyarchaeota archaeon]|nr:hypothetical protein [Candidatus Bathyarchaeota archaeon]